MVFFLLTKWLFNETDCLDMKILVFSDSIQQEKMFCYNSVFSVFGLNGFRYFRRPYWKEDTEYAGLQTYTK